MSEESLAQFEQAVAVLTKQGGVKASTCAKCEAHTGQQLEPLMWLQAPTRSGLLDGRWRLLFTTRPGTSSPIQRAFVGTEAFTVYQDISLREGADARVNNVVDFGASVGELKVRRNSL